MAKLTVRDLDAKGKEVLMRVDFNVPSRMGKLPMTPCIVAALPTIKFLLDQGAALSSPPIWAVPRTNPIPLFP